MVETIRESMNCKRKYLKFLSVTLELNSKIFLNWIIRL